MEAALDDHKIAVIIIVAKHFDFSCAISLESTGILDILCTVILGSEKQIGMFVVERMPNAKEIVQKSITNSRAIMNNSERVKEQKKSRILGRIVKAKETLLSRGFISTYIETEDIHLKRRSKEAEYEKRLREWANEKNIANQLGREFIPPSIRNLINDKIIEDIQKAKIKLNDQKRDGSNVSKGRNLHLSLRNKSVQKSITSMNQKTRMKDDVLTCFLTHRSANVSPSRALSNPIRLPK